MTLDEQNDFLILERLLPTKGTRLSREQYSALTNDITGNSSDYIKASLLQKGYLEDGNNFIDEKREFLSSGQYNTVYRIFLTDIGEKAYSVLKQKKRNERHQKIAFWLTLVFAFVSALYGVLTYYDDPKNQSSSGQSYTTSPKQLTTDTTTKNKSKHGDTLPKKVSFDSLKLKPKQNYTTPKH